VTKDIIYALQDSLHLRMDLKSMIAVRPSERYQDVLVCDLYITCRIYYLLFTHPLRFAFLRSEPLVLCDGIADQKVTNRKPPVVVCVQSNSRFFTSTMKNRPAFDYYG